MQILGYLRPYLGSMEGGKRGEVDDSLRSYHLGVSGVRVIQEEIDILVSQGEEANIKAINQNVEYRQ